jgi:vacuolar-type H+-ATPase subunit H
LREATAIDIMFLVERLNALLENGRKLPLSSNVVVDQSAALDLVEQLRLAVPEEVKQARRITEESDRILERAQEEADRVVARAQEQAAFLIEERELTRAAEQRSQKIVSDGHDQADEIRRGADEYAAGVLIRLEGEVVKVLQSIKHGLDLLDERAPVAAGRTNDAHVAEEAQAAASRAQL